MATANCLLHNLTGHCILFDDKSVDEHLNDAAKYVSRCGVAGEGTVHVRNKTKTPKIFKISGLVEGDRVVEILPGKGITDSFCQHAMIGVHVYSSNECGKVFLGESKAVRGHVKEIIDLEQDGSFRFHVHDVVDPLQRGAGLILTVVAEGYGIPPSVLEQMGVREAGLINSCGSGNNVIDAGSCLYKIYEYLPQNLKLKMSEDKCISNLYEKGKQAVIKSNMRVPKGQPLTPTSGVNSDFGAQKSNPSQGNYQWRGVETP